MKHITSQLVCALVVVFCSLQITSIWAVRTIDIGPPVPTTHVWKEAVIEDSSPSLIEATTQAKQENKGIFSDKDENDAASEKINKMEPNQRVFGVHSFPGQFPEDAQRRAVYGTRRRRVPFDVSSEFRSANPFRQVNNWRNSPDDIMFPRVSPWASVKDPFVGDYARTFGYGGNYYGGYSSFGPRASTSLRGSTGESSLPATSMGGSFGGGMFMPGVLPPMFRRGVQSGLSNYRVSGLRRAASQMIAPEFALEYPQAFGMGGIDPAMEWAARDFHAPPNYYGRSLFNPLLNGPSPYVLGGDYKFFDFYAASNGASANTNTNTADTNSAAATSSSSAAAL